MGAQAGTVAPASAAPEARVASLQCSRARLVPALSAPVRALSVPVAALLPGLPELAP